MGDYNEFLRRWNETAADFGPTQVLHELFDAAVRLGPSNTAIESLDGQVSYATLQRDAFSFAAQLLASGVKLGDRTVIYANRSPQLVAAMLGASRCGAVFIPCDRANPEVRVREICRETSATCLITDALIEDLNTPTISIASLNGAQADLPFDAPEVMPSNLCFGIYTSGSTGRPKVSVTAHAGICNTLLWSHGGLGIGPDDRVLCKASLSFDVVLWELFAPLLCGGTLLLAPPFAEKDPWLLAEAMEQLRPTTIQFVPSFIKLFMDYAPLERLQGPLRIVLAGEALLPDLRERIHTEFPQAEVWSLYGPSEASVYVTAWRSEPSRTDIRAPLGQPIANMQVHLLDEEGSVADPGETGEICLAGVGLSAGYLNQEEENARRFVTVRLSGRDLRVYRTGDFGRLGSDGVLEFAGRRDAQVKVRGNRVELGEVEACLERHPAVAIAALLAVDSATRLVAFVEFRPGMSMDTGELHTHLAVQLPSYMVPSQFHILDQVPRTIAGKIDRVKLQALAKAAAEQERGSTPDR